jgi:hypothetical protein
MSKWMCLVHLPDGSEEVRHIPGPTPVQHGFVTMDRGDGIWCVLKVTHRNFEALDGTRLDGEVWVRAATEEELANYTGLK